MTLPVVLVAEQLAPSVVTALDGVQVRSVGGTGRGALLGAEDVEALREHLGLERADVLGHSAGALVAQASWAGAHPERVGSCWSPRRTGCRAVGVRTCRRSGPPAPTSRGTSTRPRRRMRWRLRRPHSRRRSCGPPGRSSTAAGASAPRRTRPRRNRHSRRRAELGFGAGLDDLDGGALLAGLAQVQAPVLVVGGERDALTGVASVERVAASFPAARTVVLPRAGHFP